MATENFRRATPGGVVLGVASITITRSADGLVAFCKVTDPMAGGAYPSAEELLSGQSKATGSPTASTRRPSRCMAGERAYNTLREIAHGLPPEKSVNASLTMLIDLSESGKPPACSRNGRVDFHDLQTFVNVKKGTPLIKRQPPSPRQGRHHRSGDPV